MPKTIRNVYDKELSFEKLLQAHKKARRGKRKKKNVILNYNSNSFSTNIKLFFSLVKRNIIL